MPILVPARLSRWSAASRLLRLWVRIPSGVWMFCLLWVLSRVLCDGLITHAEESCRVYCAQWVWSRISVRRGHDPESGRSATGKKKHLRNWVRRRGPNPAAWGYCPVAGIFEHSNISSVFVKSVEYFDELSDSPSSEGCVYEYCNHGQWNTFLGPVHQLTWGSYVHVDLN
jgi:hypothetical protein